MIEERIGSLLRRMSPYLHSTANLWSHKDFPLRTQFEVLASALHDVAQVPGKPILTKDGPEPAGPRQGHQEAAGEASKPLLHDVQMPWSPPPAPG